MTRLPTTIYVTFGDYSHALRTPDQIGTLDPSFDMEAAADDLFHVEDDTGRDGRVFEITLDVATNRFESAREVTDECVAIVKARLEARGFGEAAE